MKVLVSPTEPSWYRERLDGITSPVPEEYGVDYLWWERGKRWGVQRKAFPVHSMLSLSDARRAHMNQHIVESPR